MLLSLVVVAGAWAILVLLLVNGTRPKEERWPFSDMVDSAFETLSTSPTPSAPWWDPCHVCSSAATFRCSRCKALKYCSEECQSIHWIQGHQEECRLLVTPPQESCSNQACNTSSAEGGHSTAHRRGKEQMQHDPESSGKDVIFEGDDDSSSETVRLSDPDVLICPICLEYLSIPVYQCKNGHIMCFVCSARVKDVCPTCNSKGEHYRCRGIEKILESIKTTCPNKKYGCTKIIPWIERCTHEKTCLFVPSCCPITNCGFVGTPLQVSAHVRREHDDVVRFSHAQSFRTILSCGLRFRFLLEKEIGTVFVLHNRRKTDGNAFSISAIGEKSIGKRFFYKLEVRRGECSLSIKVFTDIVQRIQVADHAPTHCLIVPDSYFNCLDEIELKIKVHAQGKRR